MVQGVSAAFSWWEPIFVQRYVGACGHVWARGAVREGPTHSVSFRITLFPTTKILRERQHSRWFGTLCSIVATVAGKGLGPGCHRSTQSSCCCCLGARKNALALQLPDRAPIVFLLCGGKRENACDEEEGDDCGCSAQHRGHGADEEGAWR